MSLERMKKVLDGYITVNFGQFPQRWGHEAIEKDVENTMNRRNEQRGKFKDNENQKTLDFHSERAEISDHIIRK